MRRFHAPEGSKKLVWKMADDTFRLLSAVRGLGGKGVDQESIKSQLKTFKESRAAVEEADPSGDGNLPTDNVGDRNGDGIDDRDSDGDELPDVIEVGLDALEELASGYESTAEEDEAEEAEQDFDLSSYNAEEEVRVRGE